LGIDLASMGVPVVMVYLGFLGAAEMKDRGEPFADYAVPPTLTTMALYHSGLEAV
jgi:hypothetical protein